MSNEQAISRAKFEAVIIKSMTLLNLVKKIASDVDDIKTDVADLKVRMTKVETKLNTVIKLNNLRTE
jgi:hypothetical protein